MARMSKLGTVATMVYHENTYTRVRYHNTYVVSFSRDKIILDTGGWETPTTKVRMNQASNQFNLGYYVYQKDYSWYVVYNGVTYPFTRNVVELERSN